MLGRFALTVDHLTADHFDLDDIIEELGEQLGSPCAEVGQRLKEITPI